MTDSTYGSDGPHDVNSEEFIAALDAAEKAAEAATKAREKKRLQPGFFVAPDDYMPDL